MSSLTHPRPHVRLMYIGLASIVGVYVGLEGLFNHTLTRMLGSLGADLRTPGYQRLSDLGRELTATAVTLIVFIWLVKRWWYRLPPPVPKRLFPDARWSASSAIFCVLLMATTWCLVYFGEKRWVELSADHVTSAQSRMEAHHGVIATAVLSTYLQNQERTETGSDSLPKLQIWPADPCYASSDSRALPVRQAMFEEHGMLTLKASLPWIIADRTAHDAQATKCQVQQLLVDRLQRKLPLDTTYRNGYVGLLDAVALTYNASQRVSEVGRSVATWGAIPLRDSFYDAEALQRLLPPRRDRAMGCLSYDGRLPRGQPAPMDYVTARCLYRVALDELEDRSAIGGESLGTFFDAEHDKAADQVVAVALSEGEKAMELANGWSAADPRIQRAIHGAIAMAAAQDLRITGFASDAGLPVLPQRIESRILELDGISHADCSSMATAVETIVTEEIRAYVTAGDRSQRMAVVRRHFGAGGTSAGDLQETCRKQVREGIQKQAEQAAQKYQALFAPRPPLADSLGWFAAAQTLSDAHGSQPCAGVLGTHFAAAWQDRIGQELEQYGVALPGGFRFDDDFLTRAPCAQAHRQVDARLKALNLPENVSRTALRTIDPDWLLAQTLMSRVGQEWAVTERGTLVDGYRTDTRTRITAALREVAPAVPPDMAEKIAAAVVPTDWRPTTQAAFSRSLKDAIEQQWLRPEFGKQVQAAYQLADADEGMKFLEANFPTTDSYIASPPVQRLLKANGEHLARGVVKMLGFDASTADRIVVPARLGRNFVARWRNEVYVPVMDTLKGDEWTRRVSDDVADYELSGRCQEAGHNAYVLAQLPLLGMTLSMLGMLFHGSKFLALLSCAVWPALALRRAGGIRVTTWIMVASAAAAVAIPFTWPPAALAQSLTRTVIDNVFSEGLRFTVRSTMTWQGFYQSAFERQNELLCTEDPKDPVAGAQKKDAATACKNAFDRSIDDHEKRSQDELVKTKAIEQEARNRDADVAWVRRRFPGLDEDPNLLQIQDTLQHGLFCRNSATDRRVAGS